MKKDELVAKIAQDTGLSKVVSAAALESLLHCIVQTLKKGQTVTLVGFGTFKPSVRKARAGRNPQTGKAIRIPKRRVAHFSAGKGLRDAINKT